MKLTNLQPLLPSIDTRIARPPLKTAEPFYLSQAWRALVADLISQRGRLCEQCGRTRNLDGLPLPVRLFGDHIRELKDGGAALDPSNVRLLCARCHARKTVAARAARMASPT